MKLRKVFETIACEREGGKPLVLAKVELKPDVYQTRNGVPSRLTDLNSNAAPRQQF